MCWLENSLTNLSRNRTFSHSVAYVYNLDGGCPLLENVLLLLKNLVIFSSYVSDKTSFPKPLSREKETEYILRAEEGDREAKEILIRHNLRLVAHIAKKYPNYGDNDELISIGSIGLIKATDSFRHDKGTAFATYASRCIENEILMTMRQNKRHKNNVSLVEPIGTDRDGNEMTIMDTLSEEGSIIEDVERSMQLERLVELTRHVLSPLEYDIVRLRYGLNNLTPMTQKEVGARFNISRSYVSRIEKRALIKLKSAAVADELV
jgi:RNA polymerase sporulation-specific sigma factor